MKLIFCPDCQDVFKLTKKVKSCECGKCKGKYINNIDAIYNDGIPLGFNNTTLGMAIASQPVAGWGKRFEAFVIAKNVETMTKTDNIE
jgi:hypothetical protein